MSGVHCLCTLCTAAYGGGGRISAAGKGVMGHTSADASRSAICGSAAGTAFRVLFGVCRRALTLSRRKIRRFECGRRRADQLDSISSSALDVLARMAYRCIILTLHPQHLCNRLCAFCSLGGERCRTGIRGQDSCGLGCLHATDSVPTGAVCDPYQAALTPIREYTTRICRLHDGVGICSDAYRAFCGFAYRRRSRICSSEARRPGREPCT